MRPFSSLSKPLLILLALLAAVAGGAWYGYSTVWVKIKDEGRLQLFHNDERYKRENFLGK